MQAVRPQVHYRNGLKGGEVCSSTILRCKVPRHARVAGRVEFMRCALLCFVPLEGVLRMPKRIKIGLIGCGMVAGSHVNGYLAHPQHAEIVAVCDTVEANVKAATCRTVLSGAASRRRICNRRGGKKAETSEAREQLQSGCCTLGQNILAQRCQNLQRLQ